MITSAGRAAMVLRPGDRVYVEAFVSHVCPGGLTPLCLRYPERGYGEWVGNSKLVMLDPEAEHDPWPIETDPVGR